MLKPNHNLSFQSLLAYLTCTAGARTEITASMSSTGMYTHHESLKTPLVPLAESAPLAEPTS